MRMIRKKHQEQEALGLKDRACSLDIVRFFIAEIVVALQYLHSNVSPLVAS